MVVDTIKENLCINKLIATKKEIIFVEGDMIIPDSKPDILNTICTSGVTCIYKKEVLEDKVRIDGGINTYITYLADDEKDKIRGINTTLDFSESIPIPNSRIGMICNLQINLKSIECKVINGRKIGIKATLEININVYSKEEVEIVNDIQNAIGIQMQKEELKVNSLIGFGETTIYAKDTISIDNTDNLAEILKFSTRIIDKDIKISYNKILTKADAEVKVMYLTEDNRIKLAQAKIPIVGFIDIDNVTDDNICDLNYEVKNIVIKPNSSEEHSIYIEVEVGINATVYENRSINLIQDLYSPIEIIEFDKKQITAIADKRSIKDIKQIREKINVEGLSNKSIIDVDIEPNINKSSKKNMYEGDLLTRFILLDNLSQIEIKEVKIPFEHNIQNEENENITLEIEITEQNFIIQDNGVVSSNIDMLITTKSYKDAKISMINKIETNGEREPNDYSIIIYIVKNGDTLWNIAKRFGSTVEDIMKINEIEDENKIYPNQKIFIPRYVNSGVSCEKASMINYA